MSGVFAYISYLAIYYILLVILDVVGSSLRFRKEMLEAENPAVVKFKVDFNSDVAVAAVIYLVSYYAGIFDA
jgi:multisubunit Na+/H+ antiporter MnhE subunit